MKKKQKLRLTEAFQALFWTLEVARDEKRNVSKVREKESKKEKKKIAINFGLYFHA